MEENLSVLEEESNLGQFEFQFKEKPHFITIKNSYIQWWKKDDGSKKYILDWNAVAGMKKEDKKVTITACVLPKNEKKGKRKIKFFPFVCKDAQEAQQFEELIFPLIHPKGKRKIMLIVNPVSGKKNAKKLVQMIQPILSVANIDITIIETTHAGHAYEIGKNFDLHEVDGLICVSGDGLFHELINGIMDRKDWKKAIRKELGVIPAGTGNSLAQTLEMTPLEAALAIAKGFTRPLDLWRVVQGETQCWSFLGIHWGLLCDVDIESEKYRWMGDSRYDIFGLKHILEFRVYEGKLSFLRNHDVGKTRCNPVLSECPVCSSMPTKKEKKKKQEKNEEDIRAEYVFREFDDGAVHNHSKKSVKPIITHNDFNVPPPDWETINATFSYFVSSNIPYVSKDFLTNTWAHCSDGCIDIVFGEKHKVRRSELLLSMLSGIQDGTYVDKYEENLNYLKVKAFTLIPSTTKSGKGNISVDGEAKPYQPIGAECHQGLIPALIAPAPFLVRENL